MKKGIFALVISMASMTAAHADGFRCTTEDKDLNIAVYNNTDPEAGTRNAAIMILSDPTIQYGRKTIAKFTDIKSTLSNQGAAFLAKVDLRVSESNRSGERILGTTLGQLATIALGVHFDYNHPILAGDMTTGRLVLTKRNGQQKAVAVECERYLKN